MKKSLFTLSMLMLLPIAACTKTPRDYTIYFTPLGGKAVDKDEAYELYNTYNMANKILSIAKFEAPTKQGKFVFDLYGLLPLTEDERTEKTLWRETGIEFDFQKLPEEELAKNIKIREDIKNGIITYTEDSAGNISVITGEDKRVKNSIEIKIIYKKNSVTQQQIECSDQFDNDLKKVFYPLPAINPYDKYLMDTGAYSDEDKVVEDYLTEHNGSGLYRLYVIDKRCDMLLIKRNIDDPISSFVDAQFFSDLTYDISEHKIQLIKSYTEYED